MKDCKRTLRLGVVLVGLLLGCVPVGQVMAETVVTPTVPELTFREVKIKGDDFMVLQAGSNQVQLGDYWLGYSSSDPVESLTPEYQLASGLLRSQQAVVLVGDSAVPTCDAVLAMDLPMALAETKGAVALWHERRLADGKSITYDFVDSFTWTNTKTGVADIVRPTTAEDGLTQPTWFRRLAEDKLTWEVANLTSDETGACTLVTKSGVTAGTYEPPASDTPPAVVETEEGSDASAAADGATGGNVGLLAPQITELLPNPAGTGTDATDEYVELYNPNGVVFDLSGYTLETGLTTTHSYTFPAGSVLPAQAFATFYSSETGLAMSNTSGQAVLKDEDSMVIATTDPYGTASDGKAWALADGVWYWTIKPTPGAANVIAEAAAKVLTATTTKTAVKTAAAKKTTSTVKKATTAKAKASTAKAATKKVASEATAPPRGIHPLVLALVALVAVGYGLYEYRTDLANAYYKFRTDRAARRSHRR